TWENHVIDTGTPPNPEGGTYTTAGQYTSITLGPDGRPAIAYFYQQGISGDATTAARWAQANVTQPRSSADWTITPIDSGIVEGVSPGGLTIPEGLGLFVNSARHTDG